MTRNLFMQFVSGLALFCAMLLPVGLARAQQTIATSGQANVEPTTLPGAGTSPEMLAQPEPDLPQSAPTSGAGAASNANPEAATPRRFHYALQLRLRGVYDDNLNVTQNNKISDFYFVVEPSISLGVGDVEGGQENFLRADYTLSIFRYTNHDEANTEQHVFHLSGQYRASRLTLTLVQEISLLNGGTFDPSTVTNRVNLTLAGRTRVDIYGTRLGGSYYLTGKTFLSSNVGVTINDYVTGLNSSRVYFGQIFLNHDYSPKLTFGGGGGFGYNSVDQPNPTQTFQQANLRISYLASGKLSFSATGGAEFREFSDGARGTYVSPVFDISATYKLFDGTDVSFVASRSTQNSALAEAQDLSSTSLTLILQQRFLSRFHLGLVLGYENASFFSTSNVPTVASDRSDNYYFLQPSVDAAVTRFWSVGAYYLHRRSDSSLGSLSFDDNQVGFRTSLTF